MRQLVARAADATTVRELMTPTVTCVTPDVSAEALVEMLLERNISGVPVVDHSGRPIGIVSKTDVLRERFIDGDTQDGLPDHLRGGFHVENVLGPTVADVMMPIAFVLRVGDTVRHAAALMARENIHRIPLVDDQGRVAGILTTFDLARWIGR
jgi:CBS domain-containing protein